MSLETRTSRAHLVCLLGESHPPGKKTAYRPAVPLKSIPCSNHAISCLVKIHGVLEEC